MPGGNRPDHITGAIRTPIVMAYSYRLPADPSGGLVKGRDEGVENDAVRAWQPAGTAFPG